MPTTGEQLVPFPRHSMTSLQLTQTPRLTNVASMSAIPVTFLEVHYDFWVAYLLAASALGLCLLLFAIWASKLGKVHGLSRTTSCLANSPHPKVKVVPQGTVLPQAARALTCAARNGFKLEHAKSSYQETHYGRAVPWSDQLVEELGRGLIACRVMYVGHCMGAV